VRPWLRGIVESTTRATSSEALASATSRACYAGKSSKALSRGILSVQNLPHLFHIVFPRTILRTIDPITTGLETVSAWHGSHPFSDGAWKCNTALAIRFCPLPASLWRIPADPSFWNRASNSAGSTDTFAGRSLISISCASGWPCQKKRRQVHHEPPERALRQMFRPRPTLSTLKRLFQGPNPYLMLRQRKRRPVRRPE
jgi:hypothetical protein